MGGEMTFTRRSVLGGAAVTAAAALVGDIVAPGAGAATAAYAPPTGAGIAREAQFAQLVGKPFLVQVGPSSQTLTLSAVKPLAMANLPRHPTIAGVATSGEQFSLLFSGPTSSRFGQGSYFLSSPSTGKFEMFLVPVNMPATTQSYQAVVVNV
jgi:hypothetical protein